MKIVKAQLALQETRLSRHRRRSLLKFERQNQPLLPRWRFMLRLCWSLLTSLGIIAAALSLGAVGYHGFEGLPWLDAFLNASMILSGMGPVDTLHTAHGKLFATCYALFSGLVFVSVSALLLGPIAHRLLHRFHMEFADADGDGKPDPPARAGASGTPTTGKSNSAGSGGKSDRTNTGR